MDWNAHIANTAFFNKVVDARVLALAQKGFPMEESICLRLGVVAMKDELGTGRTTRGGATGVRVRTRSSVGPGVRAELQRPHAFAMQ